MEFQWTVFVLWTGYFLLEIFILNYYMVICTFSSWKGKLCWKAAKLSLVLKHFAFYIRPNKYYACNIVVLQYIK